MKYVKQQVAILIDEYLDFAFENKFIDNHIELRLYLIDFITDLCNDVYVTETDIEPNKVNEWIEKQKNKRQKVN